jgi:hypothetical protein
MSAASSIPYKLRPNKAVDRELFLSLLSRFGAALKIENYKYIGLGGPFLEDFRILHARVGIRNMDCIEIEENVHNRQKFNRPFESVNCVHSSLEDYLHENDFDIPVILWLDYTDPRKIQQQIETFSEQVIVLPIRSIIRITLNANPGSLGKPDITKLAVKLPGDTAPTSGQQTELDWRLDRFKERLADYYPANLMPNDMTRRNFGKSLLKALYLAVEKAVLDAHDRKIVWTLATNYSDGQPMVTATLIVASPDDSEVEKILQDWEFHSNPRVPLILDLPALSTLERLTMESSENPIKALGYNLPTSDMNEDPFESFRRFYRVFPHFSRIDL